MFVDRSCPLVQIWANIQTSYMVKLYSNKGKINTKYSQCAHSLTTIFYQHKMSFQRTSRDDHLSKTNAIECRKQNLLTRNGFMVRRPVERKPKITILCDLERNGNWILLCPYTLSCSSGRTFFIIFINNTLNYLGVPC